MFYVLIEWDIDNSLSVVPLSKLLSRNGKRVTQRWGRKVFSGSILQEGGEFLIFQFIINYSAIVAQACFTTTERTSSMVELQARPLAASSCAHAQLVRFDRAACIRT